MGKGKEAENIKVILFFIHFFRSPSSNEKSDKETGDTVVV